MTVFMLQYYYSPKCTLIISTQGGYRMTISLSLINAILKYICIYAAAIIGAWRLIPDISQLPTVADIAAASSSIVLRSIILLVIFTIGNATLWDGYPEIVSFLTFMAYAAPLLAIAGYCDRQLEQLEQSTPQTPL